MNCNMNMKEFNRYWKDKEVEEMDKKIKRLKIYLRDLIVIDIPINQLNQHLNSINSLIVCYQNQRRLGCYN